MDSQDSYWLLIDGYEDEPAAFGVPPYIGFHCRYIAGD
jgi:radical SAM superfamily enzyme with C-terminal helix-hairpin-helix motif